MRLQRLRAVGPGRHVGAVGPAVAEGDVHERAGERAVGPGPQRHVHVGHRSGAAAIGIDHNQLRAALFARARHVRHHVDLGCHRVAAPDDDQIGFRHLARIGAAIAADAGEPPGLADRGADRQVLARIAHDMAKPVDAVALHQPHRAGVVERPDRLGAVPRRRLAQRLGDAVQRLVPADLPELARPLRAGAQQRPGQAVRMMDALGVAGHLRADHAGGVVVGRRPAHRADAPPIEHLDLERASGRAVVRADGMADVAHEASVAGSGAAGKPTPPSTSARPSRR